MRVKSLRPHSYFGQRYRIGEEYEVLRPNDLKALVAAKAVESIEEVALPVARAEFDDAAAQESTPKKRKRGRPRKTYSRKDLRAEDGGSDNQIDDEE